MSFEHLAYRHSLEIKNFPIKWLSFLPLYEPDLPLFPLHYFHVLADPTVRTATDRVFGFIEIINTIDDGIEVKIITNKDLSEPSNSHYLALVEEEIKERMGINNPVTYQDINNAFSGPLSTRNILLSALWQKIVTPYYDNQLPFGRLYDKVFGLIRFVASFYSKGREFENIQTHYFVKKFGERISIDPTISRHFYYLLPTYEELISSQLSLFPNFQSLLSSCQDFITRYCTVKNIGNNLSSLFFNNPLGGRLDTEKLHNYFDNCNSSHRQALYEIYNAFDKGPQRSIVFIQMFSDIQSGRLNPGVLTPNQIQTLYTNMSGSYQSPKVISLYSQQCYANQDVFPVDLWMKTLMKWPLDIKSSGFSNAFQIYPYVSNLAKVERLLWVSVQARKVHSPICDDILWCIKKSSETGARGANPLACGACHSGIRQCCPAYLRIQNRNIVFNIPAINENDFEIWTSQRNNTATNQSFTMCEGNSVYGRIYDDFSSVDYPGAFDNYPRPGHNGSPMRVIQFHSLYSKI